MDSLLLTPRSAAAASAAAVLTLPTPSRSHSHSHFPSPSPFVSPTFRFLHQPSSIPTKPISPSLRLVCRSLDHCGRPSSPHAAPRPSSAEASRTLIDVCNEGVLCTSSTPDGWPFGSAVRFAVDPEDGSPIFNLHPSALLSEYLQSDCRCSLHIQMEQPGHRKPQCTFKGRVSRVEDTLLNQKLKLHWDMRFGEESRNADSFHLMNIENILHSLDFGEPNVLVSNLEYKQASADPLRECAAKIVDDINKNHWEDIRRFSYVYAHLDLMVEEARLTWVDRLGFDMSVLTSSQELMEIRIPFSREVVDERDARSSLTMMAQIAWEFERNYNPPEVQMIRS